MKWLFPAEKSPVPTAAALGIFDGVHRGHKAVMGQAARLAREHNCACGVFTLNTATVTSKGREFMPIYSDDVKTLLLEKEGAEYIYSPAFEEIRNMSAEDFAINVLRKIMHARFVVCGRDFRFGKNAACSAAELSEICAGMGMKLTVVSDVTESGIRISSGDIRKLILSGDVEKANLLLGRDYFVSGEVIHGRQLGRQINFPTANQKLCSGCIIPRFGVYASYAVIDGEVCTGITNIGIKPTVDYSGEPLAETHFPGFEGDIYGRHIDVHLTKFIRPEMKFSGVSELKTRIAEDIKAAAGNTAVKLPGKDM